MAAQRIVGLMLIAAGAALLLMFTTPLGAELLVGLLGAAFLIAHAVTRTYGLLVPGGILTGLGAGILVESQGGPQGAVVLGLGAGFLAIAVVDRIGGTSVGSGWWWPLIPGGVLTAVGGSVMAARWELGAYLVPVALIVIGLRVLAGPRRGPDAPADRAPADGAPPAEGEG